MQQLSLPLHQKPSYQSRVISWFLVRANRKIPNYWKTEFYDLKDRLLKRYATVEGYDYQHIIKECFTCDGMGEYQGEECYRCEEGIYDEYYVKLTRWRIGYKIQHKPVGRVVGRESPSGNIIEGYVKHREVSEKLAYECFLWLALVFDWKLFCNLSRDYCDDWHITVGPSRYFLSNLLWVRYVFHVWFFRFKTAVRLSRFSALWDDDDVPF